MTISDGAQVNGRRQGRKWCYLLAALFVAVFAINVALRMLFIKHGIAIWRFGDVGEFLLVLVAMAFFVVGLLVAQESPESLVSPAANNHKGGSS
jgi:hypothetical protein